MLILAPHATPVLVVGNEGWGYVDISPLELRRVLYQSFSLLAQSRSESLDLTDLFRSEGIDTGTRVGVVGWKYFVEGEGVDPERRLEIPSYVADTLRDVTGDPVLVTNAGSIFMNARAVFVSSTSAISSRRSNTPRVTRRRPSRTSCSVSSRA